MSENLDFAVPFILCQEVYIQFEYVHTAKNTFCSGERLCFGFFYTFYHIGFSVIYLKHSEISLKVVKQNAKSIKMDNSFGQK